MEDRGLEIACPVDIRFTTQSYDMFLPRMFTIAGSRGAQVQQVGPDRFRVSINTENRAGMGTLEGDGPGSRTNEPKPRPKEGLRTGRWGQVTGTVGARALSTYEFESRQEAEDYLDRRHGSAFEGWAGAFNGLPGLVVEDLARRGRGLYNRLWGRPPPAPEPELRWTTYGLNARLQGSLGYNGGRASAFEAASGGTLDGTLTFDRGDELMPPPDGKDPRAWIQSGSVEGGVGGMYYPPQSLDRRAPLVPWFGGGVGLGGGLSFRYVSAHDGTPLRLIFITERAADAVGKLGGGRSDQYVDKDGKGGNHGAGGDVNVRLIDLQVGEYHLELTDPENLAAFDGVFSRVAPHVVMPPSPRMADTADDQRDQRIAALADRFQRHGTVARFDFDATGRALGAGAVDARPGGRAKMIGLLAGSLEGHRELQEATFIDNAVPDAQWRALPSCTMPSTGRGVGRDIGGAPGASPGFGGQSGSP